MSEHMKRRRWEDHKGREPTGEPKSRSAERWEVPERARGTYVLSGEAGLDHKHLRELLDGHGLREVPVTSPYAEFVWAELQTSFKFDPRSYRVRCGLKNVLVDEEKRIATDKGRLHEEMQKRFPEVAARHMARTRLLSSVDRLAAGETLILRPVGQWAWAGNGIYRASTDSELEEAKRELLPKCPAAIASEYISDPMLWEGKKMHLRMYWLVRSSPTFGTLLWETGKVLTAELPYSNTDYGNKAIHDTHAKSTPRNLFFPDDVADQLDEAARKSVLDQMRTVLACVGELLRDHAVPYSESKAAYEVFGVDFLVTAGKEHRVVMMEVNERVGFQPVTGDTDADGKYVRFTKAYYSWVTENAVFPMLAGKTDMKCDIVPEPAPAPEPEPAPAPAPVTTSGVQTADTPQKKE